LLGVSLRRGRAGSYRGLVHSTWARRNRHRQQYRSFLKGDLDTFAAQAFLNFSGVEWRNGRASVQSDVDRAERLRLSREATAKAKAERDKKGDAAARAAVKLLAKGGILRLPHTGAKRPLWRLRVASSCPPSAQILVLAGCFDRSIRVLTGLIAS
jgi:hypothetical protein